MTGIWHHLLAAILLVGIASGVLVGLLAAQS